MTCAGSPGCATHLHVAPVEMVSTVPIESATIRTLRGTSSPSSEWVDILELDVPTKQAMPLDVAFAQDGSLWFTEQAANKLGRLEPGTGSIRERALTTADSAPQGLVVDGAGDVWFTGSAKGYVAKLTTGSGDITEHALPDPGARPSEAALATNGAVWFTLPESNQVGRLEPDTGAVRLVPLPTPDAHPEGIVIGDGDVAYVGERNTNKIARLSPDSMSFREYVLPERARPRRLAVGQDKAIYYTDEGRGALGRLEPGLGEVHEWPCPGGDGAQPLAIAAATNGDIWFAETGTRRNALVRFRPSTERFDVAEIPSGGGGVQGMVAAADGRVFFACTGANRVAVATPRP